jgi:hypothetical protein
VTGTNSPKKRTLLIIIIACSVLELGIIVIISHFTFVWQSRAQLAQKKDIGKLLSLKAWVRLLNKSLLC